MNNVHFYPFIATFHLMTCPVSHNNTKVLFVIKKKIQICTNNLENMSNRIIGNSFKFGTIAQVYSVAEETSLENYFFGPKVLFVYTQVSCRSF